MDPNDTDPPPVVILVRRTGGFAGVRREWRAEPVDDDVPVFVDLIAECPWGDADAAASARPRGADRFRWWIEATFAGDDEHHAELGDADLTGAWRDLVDAVRAWNTPAAR